MSDTKAVDIGHGMTAALRLAEGYAHLVPDGEIVGIVLTHACKARRGQVVQDFIPVRHEVSALDPWDLTHRDPITLRPSVRFNCCGLHGFVTDGKWVPA